jgi:micrococcal nuclease
VAAKPADGAAAAAGRSPATPQTAHLAVNTGTGDAKPADKPVEIPKNVQWQPPVTAVKAADGGVKPGVSGGKAVVTYVDDGDTVKGRNPDGSRLNCRIDGIDAPEVAHPNAGKAGQAYGEQARKTLQDMVLNKEVTVRITKPTTGGSNYGRDMCQIEIEGKNVSQEMIRAGAAWLYSHFNNDPRLKAAQGEAISERRGLWAGENPIPPWQFRQMQKYGQ